MRDKFIYLLMKGAHSYEAFEVLPYTRLKLIESMILVKLEMSTIGCSKRDEMNLFQRDSER